jgi:hypothetical protein
MQVPLMVVDPNTDEVVSANRVEINISRRVGCQSDSEAERNSV